MPQTAFMMIIGIVVLIIIINMILLIRRSGSRGKRKGKGRNYVPPNEKERALWRDKEIARRLQREQDDAYERVTLRNETLSYYEMVRQKYAKKEALERLGIKIEDEQLEQLKSITPEQEKELQFRDIRDDIYVYEKSNANGPANDGDVSNVTTEKEEQKQ